jgi:hypothetical protein
MFKMFENVGGDQDVEGGIGKGRGLGIHDLGIGQVAGVAAGDGFSAEIYAGDIGETGGGERGEERSAGAADVEDAVAGVDLEFAEETEDEVSARAEPPVLFFEEVVFLLKLGVQGGPPRDGWIAGRYVR